MCICNSFFFGLFDGCIWQLLIKVIVIAMSYNHRIKWQKANKHKNTSSVFNILCRIAELSTADFTQLWCWVWTDVWHTTTSQVWHSVALWHMVLSSYLSGWCSCCWMNELCVVVCVFVSNSFRSPNTDIINSWPFVTHCALPFTNTYASHIWTFTGIILSIQFNESCTNLNETKTWVWLYWNFIVWMQQI